MSKMLARPGDGHATRLEHVRDGEPFDPFGDKPGPMNDTALGSGLEARLVKAAIAHGISLVAALARVHADLRGDLKDLEIASDLSYGDDPAQCCEVWRLRKHDGRPRPLVLFLHAGGFQHLDPASHWAFAERFAHAGAVVFNAGYRLAPQHRYPAAADDAARAWRFALARASEFGADTSQSVISGASAGANLALGLCISAARDHGDTPVQQQRRRLSPLVPRSAALFSGLLQVSDMKRLYRHRRMPHPLRARMASIAVDYLPDGGLDQSAWARPTFVDPRLDPLLYLEQTSCLPSALPALFVSSGSRDQTLEDSLRLRATLADTNVPCALDVAPGAGHAYQGLTFRADARALWERCFAFLRGRGIDLSTSRSQR
jgi:acetyl esterase/lipase